MNQNAPVIWYSIIVGVAWLPCTIFLRRTVFAASEAGGYQRGSVENALDSVFGFLVAAMWPIALLVLALAGVFIAMGAVGVFFDGKALALLRGWWKRRRRARAVREAARVAAIPVDDSGPVGHPYRSGRCPACGREVGT